MKYVYAMIYTPLLMFLSCANTYGLDSQLFISIEASNIGNLYYEIIENDKRITQPLTYTIYNSNQELIHENETDNGLLIYNDLPFGNYTIKIKNKVFDLCINPAYLKTQHLLKQLDITEHVYTNTNDENRIIPLIYTNIIGASFIIVILHKKITLG